MKADTPIWILLALVAFMAVASADDASDYEAFLQGIGRSFSATIPATVSASSRSATSGSPMPRTRTSRVAAWNA